jgi:hypothetical protein
MLSQHTTSTAASEAARRCWHCNKLLLFAYEFKGRVEIACVRCKSPNVLVGSGSDRIISRHISDIIEDARYRSLPSKELKSGVLTPSTLLAVMEERWNSVLADRARRKAEVASGLRFKVFLRDGFRCRYCGLCVDDGAVLHVDHVYPKSKGGEDTLENLVTACVDCNLGKSDMLLF